jgi:hypothetical protein
MVRVTCPPSSMAPRNSKIAAMTCRAAADTGRCQQLAARTSVSSRLLGFSTHPPQRLHVLQGALRTLCRCRSSLQSSVHCSHSVQRSILARTNKCTTRHLHDACFCSTCPASALSVEATAVRAHHSRPELERLAADTGAEGVGHIIGCRGNKAEGGRAGRRGSGR